MSATPSPPPPRAPPPRSARAAARPSARARGLGNFSAEKRRAFAFEDDAGSPTSEAGSEGDFPPADLRNGKRDEEIDARERDSRRALKRAEQRQERPMRTSSVKTGGSFVAGIAAQLAHVVGEGVDLNAVLGVAWPFVAEPSPSGMSSPVEERDLDAKAEPPGALDDTRAAAETAGETTRPETERADDLARRRRRRRRLRSPRRDRTLRADPSGRLLPSARLFGHAPSSSGTSRRTSARRCVSAEAWGTWAPRICSPRTAGTCAWGSRDPAFCHYFRDNPLALERAGAELVPFSPVAGDPLPSNCKGLLFGGGYPELYARELANNRGLRAAVTAFAAGGGAVYAECGGLAFLSQSMDDGSREVAFGKAAMCGLAPFSTRVSLKETHRWGYVRVVAREGCPLFPAGSDLRGYARRRSAVVAEPALAAGPGTVWGTQNGGEGDTPSRGGRWFAAYDVFRAGKEEKERGTRPETTSSKAEMDENVSKEGVVRAAVRAIESAEAPRRANDVPGIGRVEGYAWRNVVASYARLHFGDAPEVAAHFVDACRAVRPPREAAVRRRRRGGRRPCPPAARARRRSRSWSRSRNRCTGSALPARRRRVLGLAQRADAGRVDRSGSASPARARVPGGASSREHPRRPHPRTWLRWRRAGSSARRRRRGVWLGTDGSVARWGAAPERDVDRRRWRASGAPRLEPGSRASRDRRIDAIDAREASEERSGLVTRNAGSRLRSTAARKARTSTPSASNVATSVPDARRRSRRRRPTSPAPASISSVATRAPTDGFARRTRSARASPAACCSTARTARRLSGAVPRLPTPRLPPPRTLSSRRSSPSPR